MLPFYTRFYIKSFFFFVIAYLLKITNIKKAFYNFYQGDFNDKIFKYNYGSYVLYEYGIWGSI